MTISSGCKKNKFADAENALSDGSKFYSRLCRSRKAGMRLQEITDFTRELARLTRALKLETDDGENKDDGYGDRGHAERISKPSQNMNVIR